MSGERAVRDGWSAKAMHRQRDAAITYGQARYHRDKFQADRRRTLDRTLAVCFQVSAALDAAAARDVLDRLRGSSS